MSPCSSRNGGALQPGFLALERHPRPHEGPPRARHLGTVLPVAHGLESLQRIDVRHLRLAVLPHHLGGVEFNQQVALLHLLTVSGSAPPGRGSRSGS